MYSFFLSLYFSSLLAFSFVTHPVSYCLLLLLSAFGMVGHVYVLLGFSWYLVLFSLVYVGGVYVLFIFVSVHTPNPLPSLGMGFSLLAFFFFFFLFAFSFFINYSGSYCESSHYLCSFFEGFTYFVFCLLLLVGFVIVSIVCSEKSSFFR